MVAVIEGVQVESIVTKKEKAFGHCGKLIKVHRKHKNSVDKTVFPWAGPVMHHAALVNLRG